MGLASGLRGGALLPLLAIKGSKVDRVDAKGRKPALLGEVCNNSPRKRE